MTDSTPAGDRGERDADDAHIESVIERLKELGVPQEAFDPIYAWMVMRDVDTGYRIALRPDEEGMLDDVVVDDVSMFRAEMMGPGELWMAAYLNGSEDRVAFWVKAVKKGVLEFVVTESPTDVVYEKGSIRGRL